MATPLETRMIWKYGPVANPSCYFIYAHTYNSYTVKVPAIHVFENIHTSQLIPAVHN